MLTQGTVKAILAMILLVGVGVMFFLTGQTDLDYHNIRGVVGLAMATMGGMVLIGLQWYWWRMGKKISQRNDDRE